MLNLNNQPVEKSKRNKQSMYKMSTILSQFSDESIFAAAEIWLIPLLLSLCFCKQLLVVKDRIIVRVLAIDIWGLEVTGNLVIIAHHLITSHVWINDDVIHAWHVQVSYLRQGIKEIGFHVLTDELRENFGIPVLGCLHWLVLNYHWSFAVDNYMKRCLRCFGTTPIISVKVEKEIPSHDSPYCCVIHDTEGHSPINVKVSDCARLNLSYILTLKHKVRVINSSTGSTPTGHHQPDFLEGDSPFLNFLFSLRVVHHSTDLNAITIQDKIFITVQDHSYVPIIGTAVTALRIDIVSNRKCPQWYSWGLNYVQIHLKALSITFLSRMDQFSFKNVLNVATLGVVK